MKAYNFTYIRSCEAENIREAKDLFIDMLDGLSGLEIYEGGDVEIDKLPE